MVRTSFATITLALLFSCAVLASVAIAQESGALEEGVEATVESVEKAGKRAGETVKKVGEVTGRTVKEATVEATEETVEGVDTLTHKVKGLGVLVKQRTLSAVKTGRQEISDTVLEAKVKEAFYGHPDVKGREIKVAASQGRVTLSGVASTEEEVERAVDVALSVEGVQEVVSTIQVKSLE